MGKLIFEQGKFHFKATTWSERAGIAIENDLAKKAAFKWNSQSLRWETRSHEKAVKLRRFADESAERKFKNYFITDCKPPESIPYPDHLEPTSFQLESAWHCVTRSPSYNADEAGLGKTITSVLCMNAVPGKVLVICPAYLKYNWADEITKWCTWKRGFSILILESENDIPNTLDADITICPDSLLTSPIVFNQIRDQRYRWLFIDEAHRFKEATRKRTQALLGDQDHVGIIASAERICYLSGTPIPNGRPIELFPLLNGSAPESILWRDVTRFGKDFCNGKRVTHYERGKVVVQWDFSGASRLKQFRKELRTKLMIRHLKKDVLIELPPKTRKIIFLDEVKELRAFEKKALQDFSLEQLLGKDHTAGDIATYRKEVGLAKITPAFLYIQELLETSSEKLVIFAHHIDVVESLTRMLADFKPLMIRGGMKASLKAERVKLFQSKPEHRVMIGNMDALGVGNTLTAAPGVIVVEPSWVPGVNEQAEDRVHRMTQEKKVYCRYLALRNSLDERMLFRVLEKEAAINQVMA